MMPARIMEEEVSQGRLVPHSQFEPAAVSRPVGIVRSAQESLFLVPGKRFLELLPGTAAAE